MPNNKNLNILFFGTGPLAESVLFAMYNSGYTPALVVTKPDSLVGRHQELTAPHIKKWCELKGIPVYQPEKLKDLGSDSPIFTNKFDLAVVASYGKIIPENILNAPAHGFLNVHPSLLPLYRGPSPVESQLLDGLKEIGISIMKLDAGMDSGPILVQNKINIHNEDTAGTLEIKCGQVGGEMLTQCIQHYIDGTLIPREQDHNSATICKFIEKSQGEIKLTDDIESIKNKYRAMTPWPGIFFFHTHTDKTLRIKINKLDLNRDTLDEMILAVTPEGKSEMPWADFKHGYDIK
jgi:methionyl-tRNA formyltransferase